MISTPGPSCTALSRMLVGGMLAPRKDSGGRRVWVLGVRPLQRRERLRHTSHRPRPIAGFHHPQCLRDSRRRNTVAPGIFRGSREHHRCFGAFERTPGTLRKIQGRQIFISTIERTVSFDLFAFYRGRHHFIGIDTLQLDSTDCAQVLDVLRPSFESGALRPFPVPPGNVYPLACAAEAYQAVLAGASERVVLDPTL
jgi:hypothetical protein